jgi:hypothetical protein
MKQPKDDTHAYLSDDPAKQEWLADARAQSPSEVRLAFPDPLSNVPHINPTPTRNAYSATTARNAATSAQISQVLACLRALPL